MSREEFPIIGRKKNPYILRLKEKPKLNGSMTSVPMSLFKPYQELFSSFI